MISAGAAAERSDEGTETEFLGGLLIRPKQNAATLVMARSRTAFLEIGELVIRSENVSQPKIFYSSDKYLATASGREIGPSIDFFNRMSLLNK